MKILNLYAGIGGNRKLWTDCQVTAVELNPDIAAIYQDFFPDDKVIVADAHAYLLEHYKEYDFIWSSPPCVTHTRMNKNFGIVRWADMILYQEIILLDAWHSGKYCVENVIPYYEPLIKAIQIDRHLYWTNFKMTGTDKGNPPKEMNLVTQNSKKKGAKAHHMKYRKGASHTSNQAERNMVFPETGLYILNCARNILTRSNLEQLSLYE